MAKASPPEFRLARAAALRALGQIQTDGSAPETIEFRNEDMGFVVRLSINDLHLQKIIPWRQWQNARHVIAHEVIRMMLEELARADIN